MKGQVRQAKNELPRTFSNSNTLLSGYWANILLLVAVLLLAIRSYYRITNQTAFFDDVFIYLHMARNAVYHGTMQYFTLVDRPALLASSPFKLISFIIATVIEAARAGVAAPSLNAAREIIAISVPVQFLMLLPFWVGALRKYLIVGLLYFYFSLSLTSVSEFEGGLLFLWTITVLYRLHVSSVNNVRQSMSFYVLLAVGGLIRPEVAIVCYLMLAVYYYFDGLDALRSFAWGLLRGCVVVGAIWSIIAALFHVWPIPTTWWSKAAIPLLFNEKYMIHYYAERTAATFGWGWGLKPSIYIGIFMLLASAVVLMIAMAGKRLAITGLVGIIALVLFLFRLPANFGWYYQDYGLVFVAFSSFLLLFSSAYYQRTVALLFLFSVLVLTLPQSWKNPQLPWNFSRPSRAQPYQYIAKHVVGDGLYNFPQVGLIRIKGPEIGIIAYFSGDKGWMWDSASLAQPSVRLGADKSILKYAYPPELWIGPEKDMRTLNAKLKGGTPPVYDVWAIADRNFEAARKKCAVVIVQGAVCMNRFNP